MFDREQIISTLEEMRQRGEFENQPEHSYNFEKLDSEELNWYKDNWLTDQDR